MKALSRIVFAIVAAGCCAAAGAQTSDSDMERRARNREEAIANHERMMHGEAPRTYRDDRRPVAHVEEHGSAREKVREGARSTRNFTHRQAEKMRRFSERQNRRHPSPNPMTKEPDKAPIAIGK